MDMPVDNHYSVPELGRRILDAVDDLSVDGLAAVDEFHIGGRAATEQLARYVELGPEQKVLDVGCGLGGTTRYLADRFGCEVTGVDLTESFCRIASMLSERVGVQATFRQADALDLPFDDASFDVVWTEHAQMNIADKARFYGEIRRVLRPGGQLAFHDVFVGRGFLGRRGGPVTYPVPWAADASISHLADADALDWNGFERALWEDKTAESITFFERMLDRPPQPLGMHLLQSRESFLNVLDNLRSDAIRVVQAVLVRA